MNSTMVLKDESFFFFFKYCFIFDGSINVENSERRKKTLLTLARLSASNPSQLPTYFASLLCFWVLASLLVICPSLITFLLNNFFSFLKPKYISWSSSIITSLFTWFNIINLITQTSVWGATFLLKSVLFWPT